MLIFSISEAGFSQRERLSLQKCEDELSQKFQNQIEQQRKDWQEENRKNLEKVLSIYYVVTFRRERGGHKKPIFGIRGEGSQFFIQLVYKLHLGTLIYLLHIRATYM